MILASASNVLVWIVWIMAAFGCVGSAVAVISFSNPFYSALALIGNLGTLAVLYLLLSAEFVAAENTPRNRVSAGERYARIYEINMSRCIFCGYCELACPFDAITLGNEFEISEYSRDDLIYTKDMLLAEPIKQVPVADPSLYDTPIPYYKAHS